MTREQVARVCHEANRAYCHAIGDTSQEPWEHAPQWQRTSAINGVQHLLDTPASTPEGLHESWLRQKEDAGWSYGEIKDVGKKQHPCFLPYGELPQEQRIKDDLFACIVRAFMREGLLS